MEPNRKVDRVLDEWNAVSGTARRPVRAPRGSGRGAWSGLGLVGAGLLAGGLVLAISWFGPRPTTDAGAAGSSASPSPVSSEVAVVPSPSHSAAAATASPTPTKHPTPVPTATPTPGCTTHDLSARIVSWEGAAGSRIATVELTVTGSRACELQTIMRQRLVDGADRTLADSGQVHGAAAMMVQPGEKLSTLVQASNVCATTVAPPVTITFDVANGRLRAAPPTPTDDTVPPCNGPTQPSEIQMHDWAKA
jgi:hypothetical protein